MPVGSWSCPVVGRGRAPLRRPAFAVRPRAPRRRSGRGAGRARRRTRCRPGHVRRLGRRDPARGDRSRPGRPHVALVPRDDRGAGRSDGGAGQPVDPPGAPVPTTTAVPSTSGSGSATPMSTRCGCSPRSTSRRWSTWSRCGTGCGGPVWRRPGGVVCAGRLAVPAPAHPGLEPAPEPDIWDRAAGALGAAWSGVRTVGTVAGAPLVPRGRDPRGTPRSGPR